MENAVKDTIGAQPLENAVIERPVWYREDVDWCRVVALCPPFLHDAGKLRGSFLLRSLVVTVQYV